MNLLKRWIVIMLAVFVAAWLDKGIGLVLGGFVPNTFGRVVDYIPTANEIAVILGIYAIGLLLLTILYKVVVGVRETGIGYEH